MSMFLACFGVCREKMPKNRGFVVFFVDFSYILYTEKAYDNPKFVEDLVRDIYIKIRDLGQFKRFSVEAENFESIHNHSAYAFVEFWQN